jgi:hypothetical protein
MTPEEKAKELVNRFTKISKGDVDKNVINAMPLNKEGKRPFRDLMNFSRLYHAKQCALICVDQIILTEPNQFFNNEFNVITRNSDWWWGVKEEINKL